MPFELHKVKGGYYVRNKNTKKKYSKNPLTKTKAEKQLSAIRMNYYKKK